MALMGAMAVSFVSYFYTQNTEVTAARHTLRQLGATIERTAMIAAYLENQEIAEEAVLGLSKNEIVATAVVRNVSGDFLVEYGVPVAEFATDTAVRIPLAAPFTPSERVGELAIYPRQALIEYNARRTALEHAIVLGSYTLLVALLVMAIIQLQFVPVLRQLASELHAINPGETQRLPLPQRHRQDEIGGLVRDINRLLDVVQSKLNSERELRLEIQELEQQFRLIFERAGVGIFLLNERGGLVMVNQAFRKIFNHNEDDIERIKRQQSCLDCLFEDAEQVMALVKAAFADGQSTSVDLCLATNQAESEHWVHCVLTRIHYSVDHRLIHKNLVQGIVTDITERKQAEQIIRFQAERDPLTELANRRLAELELAARLEHARTSGGCLAICLIDLDHFKFINDTHGHEAGDVVLVEAAKRIRTCMRQEDLTARLGGDEFLVALLDSSGGKTIESVANKLLHALTQPIVVNPELTVHIGASLGIALSSQHGHDLNQLLRLADQAMYQVKRRGKNGFHIYQVERALCERPTPSLALRSFIMFQA